MTTIYDEDFEDLVCKDIKFKEGDYFDLSKHSPEQIEYLGKFYKIDPPFKPSSNYDVLQYFTWNDDYSFSFENEDMMLIGGKEYHFNDVFVTQEEYEDSL